MMAMTPYEKKTLEDIESAFLEAVETRISPSVSTTLVTKKKTKTPQRSSWFSGFKDKMAMTFVCCAPPQTLLDDDEIQEILAKIDEPVKRAKTTMMPPRVPSRKDSLLRRNSASVMPASRSTEPGQVITKHALAYITNVLANSTLPGEETPVVEEPEVVSDVSPSRTHVTLGGMQRVIVALLALHKTVETRQTERAVLAVQMKWRRRQVAPTTPPTPIAAPLPAAVPATTTPTLTTEPDLEPNAVDDQPTVSSPKRQRSRMRKARRNKKTKFDCIPNAATTETTEAVESLTQLAMTRKRLRSVDVESFTPPVDVERNVHVLFGEEEIDEDDDDVLKLGVFSSPSSFPPTVPCFTLQRCESVPPPPTAFRPRAIKSKSLVEASAASTIQHAWRKMKINQEREIQRRLQQYETEKQSVMPTIRDKMTLLQKRLEEIRSHNSCAVVAVEEPVLAPVDDDYDWL